MSSVRQQVLLVSAAALIFFVNLGKAQLWDDDEPKNAQCAREMFDRGDLIVPTFNGELRYDKPILTYWLMMSAYGAFGDGEFAARFWSAVAATGTVLLTYHIGRMLFDARIGFWAGWMMTTSLVFVMAGRAATPDSVMIFCTTLALFFFVRATWAANATLAGANRLADYLPRSWRGMALVYAAAALGVLTKGPVAVVLPMLALVAYVAIIRQTVGRPSQAVPPPVGPGKVARRGAFFAVRRVVRLLSPAAWLVAVWRLRPLTALFVLAVVAMPWYLIVGLRTEGEWLPGFFGRHNFGRYLSPMEGHGGPFWYYVPAVLFGFFPWSTFLPQALVRAGREMRQSTRWAAWLLLACWAGTWIGFFSLSGTKLPNYVAPSFPALAIMTAAWFVGWLTQPRTVSGWFLRQSIVSLALVGLALIIALPVLDHYVLPGEAVLGIIGVPLMLGAFMALIWVGHRPRFAAGALATCSLAFIILTFGFAAVRVSRHQNSNALVAALREYDSHAQAATYGLCVPSQVYYSRLQVPQYAYAADATAYLNASPQAVLVTDTTGYDELHERLPGDVTVVARQKRFLRHSEVIVLGHRSAIARRAMKPPR
jgi:4-amino-4-deoxy-L-arabinose transferase-like glycosyltransferase